MKAAKAADSHKLSESSRLTSRASLRPCPIAPTEWALSHQAASGTFQDGFSMPRFEALLPTRNPNTAKAREGILAELARQPIGHGCAHNLLKTLHGPKPRLGCRISMSSSNITDGATWISPLELLGPIMARAPAMNTFRDHLDSRPEEWLSEPSKFSFARLDRNIATDSTASCKAGTIAQSKSFSPPLSVVLFPFPHHHHPQQLTAAQVGNQWPKCTAQQQPDQPETGANSMIRVTVWHVEAFASVLIS